LTAIFLYQLAPLAPHFRTEGKALLTADDAQQLAAAEEAERQRQISGETPLSMAGDMTVAATLNEIHWGAGKGWLAACPHGAAIHDSLNTWPHLPVSHFGMTHFDHCDTDVIADAADCSFDCPDIMF